MPAVAAAFLGSSIYVDGCYNRWGPFGWPCVGWGCLVVGLAAHPVALCGPILPGCAVGAGAYVGRLSNNVAERIALRCGL